MTYFVEGIQGSGKSTLVKLLSEKCPDHKVLEEGDYSPVELAWCAYMGMEDYRAALEKHTSLRPEIEAKTHFEDDHAVVCYTKIRTDDRNFYQAMEKYEIYNPGSFPDDLTPLDFISRNLPSYKRNKLILDILFRSKDVEKSGTGFQRVNDFCKQQNVTWNYRKEAYGFFFEFIRTNVQINVQINAELTEAEQVIFNLIQNNDGISKAEMAIRIGKSEKTVQRLISSLMKKQVIEREGSNKSGSWKIKI